MDAFQSTGIGPAVYLPSAGFKDVHVGAIATIDLNDRWTLMLIGRYARLIGDAADSPIVETENQFYGGAALTYKFSWAAARPTGRVARRPLDERGPSAPLL